MRKRNLTAVALAVPLLLGTGGAAVAAQSAPSPSAPSIAAASMVYEVSTYTSNIPGAGTDGDVWVRVHGTQGSSNWLYLDNSEDNFERNKTDRFYFTLANLGYLQSVDVYFNRAGLWADWHLGQVQVGDATFPANRWFTQSGTNVKLWRA